MHDSNHILILDLHHPQIPFSITAKKGDTAKTLKIKLTDNGAPYPVSSDCYGVFSAKKPDGNIVFDDCVMEADGIRYTFTPQVCAVAGTVLCEVRLYGADSKLITSPRFILNVEDTVYTDGDIPESTGEVSALTRLIGQTLELKEDIEGKLAANAYADAHSAICFTPQALTDSQQLQSRENIAAAPAGFGLGENGVRITDVAQLDDYSENGWYRCKFPAAVGLGNVWFLEGNLRVSRTNDSTWIQELYPLGHFAPIVRVCEPVWRSEWESVSPPMIIGEEYRTTERWNNKAVFVRLVNCGALPNGSTLTVEIPGAGTVIRCSGFCQAADAESITLPFQVASGYEISCHGLNNTVVLYSSYAAGSYTAYVTAWYTKD